MPAKRKKRKGAKKKGWQQMLTSTFASVFVFLILLLGSIFIFNFSFKYKQYFTPKPKDQQGFVPYGKDSFYKNCANRFFYCKPSVFSKSRNGFYTSCQCFKPNLATYLFAPVLVVSQYLFFLPDLERMLFPIFFQAAYIFALTKLILYFLKKSSK